MVSHHVVDNDNRVFELAENFVTNTAKCIFLTGKAGTGKTTFLKHIKSNSQKKTVVVAPTGVAAINAGGTTIHSFFQLPFSPFVPAGLQGQQGETLLDRSGLLQNLRIDSEKRNLFREIELLIIDEVSMVRCDVLDAIDTILRFFRRKEYTPFGGVQVLLIGDLYQLPPVVQPNEWAILKQYYESPFFFDSRVIREVSPVYIELKKIYRQTDADFINLLNKIRNNETTQRDIDLLNLRYNPDFKPEKESGYVTLTTHNSKADKINNEALKDLPGEPMIFSGEVEGDFPERNYPTEKNLMLKVGAQVMFIKNDTGAIRRYYNGKIGTVTSIRNGKIVVSFPGEDGDMEVAKDTWRNVRYTFNPVTRQVEEEVLGAFTQFAIRLAWAITIHKSQGLTFNKVIIDAGSSFAAGQVYVALSRCTSLDGIILYSRIFNHVIRSDERVLDFAEEELSADQLQPVLQLEKQQFKLSVLLDKFDWSIAFEEVETFKDLVASKKYLDQERAAEIFDKVEGTLHELSDVMRKFSAQLRNLVARSEFTLLQVRVDAGVSYFSTNTDERILFVLREYDDYLKTCKKVKKVRKKLGELIAVFETHKKHFTRANAIASSLTES